MGKRSQKSSVLMVCVGNLCRSPIAEAVMRDVVTRAGLQGEWHVESAGIEDWHSGRRPDERALNVLARHNIDYHGKARVLAPEDFFEFDYIFAMDLSNLAALRRMAPKGTTAKLLILGNFGLKPDERIIEDPYYDISEAPFEQIYRQCSIACKNFLKQALLKQIM
ncbi:low molecular weight phosphotyrosine protein phosphatase 2 isoform X1 [Drosophila simulans]|uniref:Low molecular weight phosphotyrosine protein phosphatase n=1 Tax=Drosophila simulans TaxID=7240 RepID=B4R157_DROSI|nr:low molecular weight phosphotyrosine protein phosphatase 2 isoform X1 [Drosophila simulans]EDX13034.1 GD20476 [Drosophila simulans]KMZ03744.1 uncharacterized protein Dsimw501_GD20476 [Drosophila simulans]